MPQIIRRADVIGKLASEDWAVLRTHEAPARDEVFAKPLPEEGLFSQGVRLRELAENPEISLFDPQE